MSHVLSGAETIGTGTLDKRKFENMSKSALLGPFKVAVGAIIQSKFVQIRAENSISMNTFNQ